MIVGKTGLGPGLIHHSAWHCEPEDDNVKKMSVPKSPLVQKNEIMKLFEEHDTVYVWQLQKCFLL